MGIDVDERKEAGKSVTASIVLYRTPAALVERVVGCALDSGIAKVWVVDQSPATDTPYSLPADDRIVYVRRPNLGYGSGNNHAIRESMAEGHDYHIVLNPDVYWDGDVVERLSAAMTADPSIGALHPRVVNPDGTLQYTVRLLPSPADLIGRRFLGKRLNSRRDSRYLLKHWDHSAPLDIAYHQGSFMFLRLEALKKTGLFDERFFLYPEDIDLTRRIHRHYKTLYWPSAQITHEHNAASYRSLRMLGVHIWNMIKYFNKWGWWRDPERQRWNRETLAATQGRQLPEGSSNG